MLRPGQRIGVLQEDNATIRIYSGTVERVHPNSVDAAVTMEGGVQYRATGLQVYEHDDYGPNVVPYDDLSPSEKERLDQAVDDGVGYIEAESLAADSHEVRMALEEEMQGIDQGMRHGI